MTHDAGLLTVEVRFPVLNLGTLLQVYEELHSLIGLPHAPDPILDGTGCGSFRIFESCFLKRPDYRLSPHV